MESSGNLISLPTVKCKNSHAPTDPQKRRVSKICYHFLHCYGRPTEARLGRGFILFGSFFQLYQILVTVIFAIFPQKCYINTKGSVKWLSTARTEPKVEPLAIPTSNLWAASI